VVGHLQIIAATHLRAAVEQFGHPLVVIDGFALTLRKPGEHDVRLAYFFGMLAGHLPFIGHGAAQIFITGTRRDVATDNLQIIGFHHFFELSRADA